MKAKILIVEDEPALLETFQSFLEQDYRVFAAPNASQALTYIDEIFFKIALVDLNLPDGDGLHIVRYLALHHPHTAVFVLTANKDIETVKESIALGASDYIVKPITQSVLKKRIEKYFLKQKLSKK